MNVRRLFLDMISCFALVSPPSRYQYGYVDVQNPEGQSGFLCLHTITTPSPTGTGTATAMINYQGGMQNVASLVDAKGEVGG